MSELFHVLNRGVEKRDIFLDNSDRARFVHDMWEFNDTRVSDNVRRRLHMTDIVSPSLKEKLVDIHGWCLMDNHYHLLLSEVTEGGISQFMRRLNVGYAKYFNTRYERSGYLFQGRTKKIQIRTDAHYLHILHYIHLNPLDMLRGAIDWREHKIHDFATALTHLNNYRWSSYLDYCNKKNFPSILTKDLFQNTSSYEKEIKKYLGGMERVVLESYQLE